MQALRRFLSPGWVLGLLAVVLFTWACFALLAPWQLGKSDDLDARNARLAESIEAAPEPLGQVVGSPADFVEREWRLVTLEGTWQPDAEALLRLRSVDGELVYQILTVFRGADGEEFLVNRGWVPVGENNTVPDYPRAPSEPVEITARLRATEAGQAEPVLVDGRQAVRVVDPAVLGETLGHDLEPAGYLQLTGDQPGSLTPAPVPGIESGPYLSYGLQWLLFGLLAPVGLAYFAWSEMRTRRRVAEQEAPQSSSAAPAGGGGDGEGGAPAPAGDGEGTADPDVAARDRAMFDRYGERYDAEQRRAARRRDRLRQA